MGDRSSMPLYGRIVRTADYCEELETRGYAALIAQRTGLRIDPYFSATKLGWVLDTVPGARAQAEAGKLAFGTVDSFLLWRLTHGAVHAIDATNASRTLLCDIRTGTWDDELLRLFRVPAGLLPEIRDSSGYYGETSRGHTWWGDCHSRRCWRPAGRADRPSLLQAGYCEGNLWHRRLRTAQYRPGAEGFAAQAADDRSVATQGDSELTRSRDRSSLRVQACSGCATDSDWSKAHRRPAASRTPRTRRSRSTWYPLSPVLERRTGTAERAR